MTAPQQTVVAVLAAFGSEDDEAIGVVVGMLREHDPVELVNVIAGLCGVTLALGERLADELVLERSDLLRFYLTGLGEFAAAEPPP